jgi:two-component system response regulator YesN
MLLRKTWYTRMLLSYFPIFLITISVILFVFFIVVSEITKQEAEKASRISTGYVIQSLERSLQEVERMVLKEMQNNRDFRDFYESTPSSGQALLFYYISDQLKKMVDGNPIINSIYLYRAGDQTVLTRGKVETLDQFRDKDYVLQAMKQAPASSWSGLRAYTEFDFDKESTVITMTKKALLPFGTQGLLVINVNADGLYGMIDEMIETKVTFMDMYNDRKERLYSANGKRNPDSMKEGTAAAGKILTETRSRYLGWTIVSGIKAGQLFAWVSVVSYIWIVIGIVMIVFSIVYMIYITRMNYKPIRVIMERIHNYQQRSLQRAQGVDEFAFIEKALESLIDQTTVYEKRHREDLLVRRKQFFLEVIEGDRLVSADEWERSMTLFQQPAAFQQLAVVVIEVRGYADFQQSYNERDQSLLKFALSNVVQEFARKDNIEPWAEWVTGHQLTVIAIVADEAADLKQQLAELSETCGAWVTDNLKLAVVLGIGPVVTEVAALTASYDSALTALQFKWTRSSRYVIPSKPDGSEKRDSSIYPYMQRISQMVTHFRIMNEAWESELDEWFAHLRDDLLKDEEIRQLSASLIQRFHRELEEMAGELKEQWNTTTKPQLQKALDDADSLEEVETIFGDGLKELYRSYVLIRETKSYRNMVNEMRSYIEENYTNPDLSLKHLSDRFDISGKYASHLFKEELGMKFVDFLVELRIEKAKSRLLHSADSIQDIALQVGYANSITFGRMFKKIVNTTPGDYRKYMQVERGAQRP